MQLLKVISVFLFLIITLNLSAQDKAKQIEDLMSQCYANGIFNGSILVAEKGKIIYHKSLGYADFDNKIELDKNTPSFLASLGKQITAMGIMILKEQGKLSFEDKIGKYFPDIPEHIKGVTIRNLLNHTSGIKDHYRVLPRAGLTNEAVIGALSRSDSLMFEPSTQWRYSNTGYCMLGVIIEKVSKQSYPAFLEQHIFLPLGMTNTFVKTKSNKDEFGRAIGYDRFGQKSDNVDFTYGDGGIYSTVEDLFRWSQALNTDKIVSQELILEAFTPAVSNNGELIDLDRNKVVAGYGFGWIIQRGQRSGLVSHSGNGDGFKNIILKNRIENMEIIYLTNKGWSIPLFELETELLNIMNGKAYKCPIIPISVALSRSYQKDKSLDLAAQFYTCKNGQAERYKINESELTYLGYYFLKKNHLAQAETIFKINIDENPEAWNAYDCYAEVCFKKEKYKLAIKNYKKSLALNPKNDNATKMIERSKEAQAVKRQNQD